MQPVQRTVRLVVRSQRGWGFGILGACCRSRRSIVHAPWLRLFSLATMSVAGSSAAVTEWVRTSTVAQHVSPSPFDRGRIQQCSGSGKSPPLLGTPLESPPLGSASPPSPLARRIASKSFEKRLPSTRSHLPSSQESRGGKRRELFAGRPVEFRVSASPPSPHSPLARRIEMRSFEQHWRVHSNQPTLALPTLSPIQFSLQQRPTYEVRAIHTKAPTQLSSRKDGGRRTTRSNRRNSQLLRYQQGSALAEQLLTYVRATEQTSHESLPDRPGFALTNHESRGVKRRELFAGRPVEFRVSASPHNPLARRIARYLESPLASSLFDSPLAERWNGVR